MKRWFSWMAFVVGSLLHMGGTVGLLLLLFGIGMGSFEGGPREPTAATLFVLWLSKVWLYVPFLILKEKVRPTDELFYIFFTWFLLVGVGLGFLVPLLKRVARFCFGKNQS